MSTIVQSYDASNNAVYPVTHLRAVRDSNGTTLESMMQDVREMAVGYYECSTPGSTAAKTITTDSSVFLSTKILCKVKFVEKNTANNTTMNINGTGAKALYYNGVRAAANNSWYPNEVVDLYYDGTNCQAKSCADTLEYDVSLHQTHEITEITKTTRTLIFNGNVVSSWESETPVSDSSVEGYTRSETNTGQDVDSTTVDGPNATYDTTANKTNVVYVTTHTYTHVVNNYTFKEAVNAVPMSYRHGGLKLRFISNSDSSISGNKYVQYRLMATAWSNIIADWQGVDNEPTAGSNNLVKSGGVAEKLSELESEVKLEFGTIPYEYSTNIPCLIDGKFNNGDVLFFETDKNNGGATTLGGYIVEGGFEDIIIASPPGRMHRIVLNNSYDRLSLFSSKNGKAKVYMEDSINQKLNSINTELGGIDARIESATTTETDISSEFVPGYWNTNNGVGQQAYFSESSTLFTLKINITKGQIYISNTELATNQAVSHALLDNNNTIIALLTTQELNNGVQITDAIIESGATNIVITYRSTLQTTPISCIVKGRVTDSVENIKSELQEIENDKTIYRHYVSKTQDTIFVYTKGYAIGEDLCCRMMNRNINGIWDFFDWQRIPNTTDIVASTFDGHILINGGTGTDYISAYTVAAVNNADGDSQVINPTGGWHGYNSLTANVTATARTIMLKVFADGKEVGENESAYCNDVKIMFVNNVQGWNTQKADGTGREILQQKCTIIFNKFDINIEIETTALEDVKLIKHYGLNAQNNMNSSDVVVQFVGELRTIPQSSNGQSSDKESRMLRFCGDNDIFSLTIDNFGEGTFKYNALEYSGIYVGATKKGYFGCIYRNAESEQDWVELSKGASLFLKGSYECKANL